MSNQEENQPLSEKDLEKVAGGTSSTSGSGSSVSGSGTSGYHRGRGIRTSISSYSASSSSGTY